MIKRNTVRIFSFALTILVVLGAFGISSAMAAQSYRAQLESNYRQSLSELSECLSGIETDLTKSIYANSATTLTDVSRNLYTETNQAKDALSRLPVNQMNLDGTYKFLSQAGDYSSYLSSKLYAGQTISDDEHQNLRTLLTYATKYRESIDSLLTVCNNGGEITERNVRAEDNTSMPALSTDFTTAEEAFEDYPTLLYDGPFADAVLNKQSKMIKGAKKISKNDAKEIAAKALSCNVSELSQESDEEGRLPAYIFTRSQQTVAVTKNGGYVSYILFGGKISTSTIDEKNAVNLAKAYLDKIGYTDMESSYYAVSGNVCTINFAYSKNGVTCYSDLIKVGVSMSDGTVVSLEAKGFLTNHEDRDIPDFKVSEKEAEKAVSQYLTIKNTKKCIIPKDNGKEVACWEITVQSSETGEDALIYVNAATGVEEDIMLLLYSDNGTLTK